MINIVIDTIKPKITALPFVERFGGLARTIKKIDVNDLGIAIESRFPVSCSVTPQECWQKGKYLDLCPNDNYKSVFYFEEITGLQKRGNEGPKGRWIALDGQIRLVGWLNLLKLGLLSNCSATNLIAANIIKDLAGKYTPASPFIQGQINVELIRQLPKTPDIFAQYSYDNTAMNFLLYPYDYLALDFRVQMMLNLDCVSDVELGDPAECIDLTVN